MNKIKDQKSMIKNTNQKLKSFFVFVLVFLFGFFLFLNIFSSQRISPVFYKLSNNSHQATVDFLKKIKTLPEFPFYMATNINIFGHSLENEVFSDQKKKEEKIAELEAVLKKNPKSRDILYNLYLLSKELNKNQEAEKYLKLAKEIDPEIK